MLNWFTYLISARTANRSSFVCFDEVSCHVEVVWGLLVSNTWINKLISQSTMLFCNNLTLLDFPCST